MNDAWVLIGLVAGTTLLTVFTKIVSDLVRYCLYKLFVKTKRHQIFWIHGFHHKSKSPEHNLSVTVCIDGQCTTLGTTPAAVPPHSSPAEP